MRNSTRGLERASEPDSEVVNLTFLGRGSVSEAIKKATTTTRRDDCLSRAALFACGRIASLAAKNEEVGEQKTLFEE